MFNWLRSFKGQQRITPVRNRWTTRLLVEPLEDRCVPTTGLLHFPFLPDSDAAIIPQLATASEQTPSTIPANSDVNPYGVAFVPQGFTGGGSLHAGDNPRCQFQ